MSCCCEEINDADVDAASPTGHVPLYIPFNSYSHPQPILQDRSATGAQTSDTHKETISLGLKTTFQVHETAETRSIFVFSPVSRPRSGPVTIPVFADRQVNARSKRSIEMCVSSRISQVLSFCKRLFDPFGRGLLRAQPLHLQYAAENEVHTSFYIVARHFLVVGLSLLHSCVAGSRATGPENRASRSSRSQGP